MTMRMKMRRGGSAAPSFALTAQTSDGGDLPTNHVMDVLDPPPVLLAGDVLVP